MALRDYTLVEVFGEQKDHRCGYCKSDDTNQSYGMWAHFLSVQDYENLLNRGWRRSGKYLYKPTNHLTCCPAYTINCHALEFKLSKSQKKVLRKFNNYLLNGQKFDGDMKSASPKFDETGSHAENISAIIPLSFKEPQAIHPNDSGVSATSSSSGENKLQSDQSPCSEHSKSQPKSAKSSSSQSQSQSIQNPISIPVKKDESRGQVRKAKAIRLEMKKQKLIQKGIDPATVLLKNQSADNQAKSIEDFMTTNANAKHKLTVRTVRVSTKEFEETFELEYNLYLNYQIKVHQDDEHDCTRKQFNRFLCDSPLVNRSSELDDVHGSFHQQYYLNDELVAVGVIDILPSCLSSVYFFYNPDYMFLSLGTFGALKEIAYVRQLNTQHSEIQYYYMGFYIHSCVKMRYKGNYAPSYLLCPEKFSWHLLDDKLGAKLTSSKYSRLNEGPNSTKKERVNFKNVTVLHEGHRVPYFVYRELDGGRRTDEEVQKYADLVGDTCAKSIIAYLGSLRESDD